MKVFGSTRSTVRSNHALIEPDSFVPSPLPGWSRTQAVILKQGFECYAIAIGLALGTVTPQGPIASGSPREAGTNDRASASNAFKRDDAEWLRPS